MPSAWWSAGLETAYKSRPEIVERELGHLIGYASLCGDAPVGKHDPHTFRPIADGDWALGVQWLDAVKADDFVTLQAIRCTLGMVHEYVPCGAEMGR